MVQKGRRETAPLAPQVFMIFRPALRFLTGPRPPADLAARRFAAVIRPPLLFFAIVKFPFFKMQFYVETRSAASKNGRVPGRPVSFGRMEMEVLLMT